MILHDLWFVSASGLCCPTGSLGDEQRTRGLAAWGGEGKSVRAHERGSCECKGAHYRLLVDVMG